MKERVRKALHQSAQAASSSGDLGRAQEIYELLRGYYAGDEEARIAAARLDAQLSSRRGELQPLLRKAEEAMRNGNLIEPQRASGITTQGRPRAIDPRMRRSTHPGSIKEKRGARASSYAARY